MKYTRAHASRRVSLLPFPGTLEPVTKLKVLGHRYNVSAFIASYICFALRCHGMLPCSIKSADFYDTSKSVHDGLGISGDTSDVLTRIRQLSHLGYSRQCVGAIHIVIRRVEADLLIQETRLFH